MKKEINVQHIDTMKEFNEKGRDYILEKVFNSNNKRFENYLKRYMKSKDPSVSLPDEEIGMLYTILKTRFTRG